ncbi:NADH(P)-binding family protein [Mycobacterium kansasii]|uniref:NADH(P)-binding family protein n=1 Tax=Mycobacterium kansasii TaxID=1768 RepID=A0A1V3X4C8_MYCKA|nr:NADH(P)-binding family protein [Mycobacterium kansasii]
MRIAVAGAGKVGRSVAHELLDRGHKVLLIERQRNNFEPHTVPAADWLHADACELSTMHEAGVQTCDVLIAATGDDKANLVVGLLAKTEFGCPGWWRGSTTCTTSGCSAAPGASMWRSRRRAP